MFFNASSLVSPSLIHTGKAGTKTVYPPSSLGSKIILSFIGSFSLANPWWLNVVMGNYYIRVSIQMF